MGVAKFTWFLRQELRRMVKYKIIQISFLLALLWCGVLFLSGEEAVATFLPLFIFVDASVMSMMMMGAILFYERQENTLKPLLVTPLKIAYVIAARLVVGIVIALQSALILSLFARFVMNTEVAFVWLFFAVVLVAFTHAVLGYVVSLFVKDFNGLLMNIVAYMMFFGLPTILFALGVISDAFERVLLFSPTHGSFLLIGHSLGASLSSGTLVFVMLYLVLLSVGLLIAWVAPNYARIGVKE